MGQRIVNGPNIEYMKGAHDMIDMFKTSDMRKLRLVDIRINQLGIFTMVFEDENYKGHEEVIHAGASLRLDPKILQE